MTPAITGRGAGVHSNINRIQREGLGWGGGQGETARTSKDLSARYENENKKNMLREGYSSLGGSRRIPLHFEKSPPPRQKNTNFKIYNYHPFLQGKRSTAINGKKKKVGKKNDEATLNCGESSREVDRSIDHSP